MYFFKRNFDSAAIRALLRCYSLGRRNHYEVLKLRRNCSDKEIKQAFIKMSKEFHPDKNKDAKAQDSFVRIVEAYEVLGKPSSRARYDSMTELESNSYPASSSYMYKSHDIPYNIRNHPQYSYYYETQAPRSKHTTESSSVKKIPNYVIIVMCTGVALLGIILQVFVIRNLYVAQRRQAQEKSKRLAEELDKVRAAALTNGNELQTRILLDKIVAAANTNVATASLGQALASEKKKTGTPIKIVTEFGVLEMPNSKEEWKLTTETDSQTTLQSFIGKVMSNLMKDE